MNRRAFLIASSAIPAVALGGCGEIKGEIGQIVDSTLADVVAKTKLVAGGAQALVGYLPALGLSADAQSIVQAAVSGVQQVADDVATVMSADAAKPFVQKLGDYLQTIVNVLAAVPIMPPVAVLILNALKVAIPAVLQILGIAGVTAPKALDSYNAFAVLKQYGTR